MYSVIRPIGPRLSKDKTWKHYEALTLKKGQGQDRETEACLCQFHLYPLLSGQVLALRQTRASQRKLGIDYDEHQPSTLSFHPETFEA